MQKNVAFAKDQKRTLRSLKEWKRMERSERKRTERSERKRMWCSEMETIGEMKIIQEMKNQMREM